MQAKKSPSNGVNASGFTKFRAIACPMLVNLSIGAYYSYSNINPYIATYLKSTPESTIIVNQIWLLLQTLFAIVGVKLSDKLGYWTINLIAFWGFAVLNLVVSFIDDSFLFVIVYGTFAGITIGLGYLPALYISWTYFPDKKSLVTGSILFCAGMSASFMSPVSTWIVNPDNLSRTDPGYGDNVPKLFRFYSVFYGGIALLACSLQPKPYVSQIYKEAQELEKIIKEDPERRDEARATLRNIYNVPVGDGEELKKGELQLVHRDQLASDVGQMGGEEYALLGANISAYRITDLVIYKNQHDNAFVNSQDQVIEDDDVIPGVKFQDQFKEIKRYSRTLVSNADDIYKKSKQLQEESCPSVEAAVRSSTFKMLVGMALCTSMYPYFLNSNWKSYFQSLTGTLDTVGDSELSFILTFGAVANSTTRILVGYLLLKVEVKVIYYAMISVAILGAFTISSFLNSYTEGVLYVVGAYIGIGSQVTFFPTISTKVFGSTIGPKVYPYLYFCFSVSNFTQYFLYHYYGNKHYSTMFTIFGCVAVVGLAISVFFNPNPSWAKEIYSARTQAIEQNESNQTKMLAGPINMKSSIKDRESAPH